MNSSSGIIVSAWGKDILLSLLDWLRLEFEIEKPSQKLQALAALNADGLIGEVKKLRGKQKPLTVAEMKRLKEEHAASVVPLQALEREADVLERQVSDLINEAFGLTPEDVRLMRETAPPRTARPAAARTTSASSPSRSARSRPAVSRRR